MRGAAWLQHWLGGKAAGPGGSTRASFANGAVRELSAGLCRGHFFFIERLLACWLGQVALASGLA
jgi:hypothetical protein